MLELIEKIRQHTLGNKDEAFSLYFTLCDCLKEKYGLVDRGYDKNPTKRGKEWLDIHHISEYELDDIARRTENAKYIDKLMQDTNNEVIVINSCDSNDNKKRIEIRQVGGKSGAIYGLDYTLDELKPYNVKEQLVYANKIEHFLLHYLIETIRGKNVASGGPNYLWDCSIALDVYGFDQEYMNNLQSQKENFYSIVSSEEITRLYKKLIDWKNLNLQWCERYWYHYKNMLIRLHGEKVSYVSDKDKFFNLFGILDYYFKKEDFDSIEKLPYKVKTFCSNDGTSYKIINRHIFKGDGKTVVCFNGIFERKSFTIPYYVEGIAVGAFDRAFYLETITIPTTVKEIEDTAFIEQKINVHHCAAIQKIIYKGTKQMWDANFSNVELDGITLVCKK